MAKKETSAALVNAESNNKKTKSPQAQAICPGQNQSEKSTKSKQEGSGSNMPSKLIQDKRGLPAPQTFTKTGGHHRLRFYSYQAAGLGADLQVSRLAHFPVLAPPPASGYAERYLPRGCSPPEGHPA